MKYQIWEIDLFEKILSLSIICDFCCFISYYFYELKFGVENQQDNEGASPKRARYHSGLMNKSRLGLR